MKEKNLSSEEIKKLNIYEKMSLITSELGVIEKGLNVKINDKASYKAVSERDILDNVKPIEEKYRIFSFPSNRKIIESDILEKENQYGITKSLFMRIETTYIFVNIDNPTEQVETTTYGDGIDTGDKATGKAMTYSDKYALMKAYKISTGDDPDKEPSPETGYTTTDVKATPKQIEILVKNYTGDNLTKLLQANSIQKIEDISMKKASELISKLVRKGN